MSFIHRYRPLLLALAVLVLLAVVSIAVDAQGRGGGGGGGGRGGGGGAGAPSTPAGPGGGGGGGPRAGGPGPGGPGGSGGGGARAGGPGPGGPRGGGPGYGYGGYYGGYGPRTAVVIGGYHYQPYWSFGFGWGYPYYPYYGGFYGYGYPYPYYGYPYPYGYGSYDDSAAIRLDVTPRTAQVFVDGYIAGTVDEFDGVFQRLRLRPGSHQITLYLEGFHTVTQNLYLAPASDQKITYKLEPLPAGETAEAPPVPIEQPQDQVDVRPPVPPNRPDPQSRNPAPSRQGTFGTLSIRVLPNDADIVIDGERWVAPAGLDRVAIELSEGRHHVEVRKDGFAQYEEDILIRRGATLTLNVSLLRGSEGR